MTWVPIIAWAVATGHLKVGQADAIFQHLGVHVRCLVAIPLFILSEPLADRVFAALIANFVASGLIASDEKARFTDVLRSVARLRDSTLIWIGFAVVAAATAVTAGRHLLEDVDALTWGATSGLDFGGQWALYFVRPLFLFMLLGWLWRLLLTWVLFRRIAKLDLQLVPSHPDRVAGLGFVGLHSVGFSLVVLAISSVVCAAIAHQLLSHGAHISQFSSGLITLVILLGVLFILPLTAFSGELRRVSVRARFEYGTLAGRHVRGLHERWVEGKKMDDPILHADEIGPAADVATLYQLATQMRFSPIGKLQLIAVVLPAVVPVLVIATLQVPIEDILLRIVKALT